MALYLSIIAIGTIICATLNSIFAAPVYGFSVTFAILAPVSTVILLFTIDAIVAITVRAFPPKHFDPNKKFFAPRSWEPKLYNLICVRKWKDKIPEVGKILVKFDKRSVEDKDNPEYLYKFLVELGYAEVMHWLSGPIGFLAIFLFPLEYALLFGVPLSIVNLFLQILPAIVQRFNRPRLLKLYNYKLKTAQTKNKAD